MKKSKLLGALAGATLSLGAAQAETKQDAPIVRFPIVTLPGPIIQLPIGVCGPQWCPIGIIDPIKDPLPIVKR